MANPDRAAGGNPGDQDEAVWLDLVARFGAPAPEADDSAPWPDREDLPGPVTVPSAVPVTAPMPVTSAPPPELEEDHYVPPPPPPLPRLDPVTKLAWLALFGGPCYLLIATTVGWAVSGLATFLCVAAFVGGFAVLVFRMDNGGPRDSGPDDGAVV